MLITLGRFLSPCAQARLSIPATPSLYTAILDGDSLSSNQIWPVPTSTNVERRQEAYWTNAAAQLYQMFRLRYANGYGTTGHKIAAMIADQTLPLSFCAANSIDAVFTLLGTNDVEDTGRTVAALKTDYTTFLTAYVTLDHRPYVFVGLPQPRADWEGELEATRAEFVQRLHDIRTAITEVVASLGSRCILWDAWDDMVNPNVTNATNGLTYYPLAGRIQVDGIHFSATGAHWVGKALAAAVKSTSLWTAPAALPDATGAYNLNPGLTGTGGSVSTGASGQVANNCRVIRGAGSNLTLTCSKETKTIFGISQTCQKIVLAGATAAGEEGYFYIEYPEPNVVFDGTTGLDVIVPVRISNPVGMTNVYLYNRVDLTSTYTMKDMAPVTGNFLASDDTDDIEWLLRTEPLLLPAGTSTRHQLMVRMPIDGTVVGAGATIWIGNPIVRQVNV